jgi:hypothetical protein
VSYRKDEICRFKSGINLWVLEGVAEIEDDRRGKRGSLMWAFYNVTVLLKG